MLGPIKEYPKLIFKIDKVNPSKYNIQPIDMNILRFKKRSMKNPANKAKIRERTIKTRL